MKEIKMHRHAKDGAGNLVEVAVSSDLVDKALKATGAGNRREVLELGLRSLLLQMKAQQELKQMRGTVEWEGDLESMRADR